VISRGERGQSPPRLYREVERHAVCFNPDDERVSRFGMTAESDWHSGLGPKGVIQAVNAKLASGGALLGRHAKRPCIGVERAHRGLDGLDAKDDTAASLRAAFLTPPKYTVRDLQSRD
jgi:hypothetical protein